MRATALCLLLALALPAAAVAQTFSDDDPVLRRIWAEGMDRSQVHDLAQALMDSVGPRLTGSPGHEAGNQWLIDTYRRWGAEADTERYGSWLRWRRGRTHIDLVEPRVRTLDGMTTAWTPGTDGRVVRGGAVTLPEFRSVADFEAWLPEVQGRFVAATFAEPTCRPDNFWHELAQPSSFEEMDAARTAAEAAWEENLRRAGFDPSNRRSLWTMHRRLEDAGAAGVLTSIWPDGWGAHRVFNGGTETVPTLALSCEDYGLVHRLAENGQGPVLEVMSDNEFLDEGPVYNVIARIEGSERPDEYVMLSAHFDSWDGASGATDNGTGTVTMLEAIRILTEAYPRPRRTILVGHWGGEEQGLNGSRAYAADHPEVVDGLQALFNQDNGTFQIARMDAQGLVDAAGHLGRWLSRVPAELTEPIEFDFPGQPSSGGTDHAAFICYGAPGFRLGSSYGDYRSYTWHTNRDTFDKVILPELRANATLTAMLTYLAAADPEPTPRTRRTSFDEGSEWPECGPARRAWEERRQ